MTEWLTESALHREFKSSSPALSKNFHAALKFVGCGKTGVYKSNNNLSRAYLKDLVDRHCLGTKINKSSKHTIRESLPQKVSGRAIFG